MFNKTSTVAYVAIAILVVVSAIAWFTVKPALEKTTTSAKV